MKVRSRQMEIIPTRAAGVLMHISSLPGSFGTGDLGPGAFRFADNLHRAGQKYWQLLPLNPTEASKGFSPYSAYSSVAGNTLFISPEKLAEQGLLKAHDVKKYELTSGDSCDFKKAAEIRSKLFEVAFRQFVSSRLKKRKAAFDSFCRREKWWLDNFAYYVLLKKLHEDKPWYEWDEPYRHHEPRSLKVLGKRHGDFLLKTKWLQFIFFEQWNELRQYCNSKEIRLFGDLPFYVSYDSVDVWAYPDIFSLDRYLRPKLIAGVPPDYFNADGQLWGMPVFRWNKLKETGYEWWTKRLSKNMEFFNLLRLDHFRAFADYWAVPAVEKTAKNGSWKAGPGVDFFSVISRKLGKVPFVAEDLGDINEKVRSLRRQFEFPGMKVLHFAFGDSMGTSEYIPHNHTENFVVYTGTHDNNTTRGWFENDATSVEKQNLASYIGAGKLTSRNVSQAMIRLAYSSSCRLAIIPVQDILGLDGRARINAPATIQGNWQWRMLPGALSPDHEDWLKSLTTTFGR